MKVKFQEGGPAPDWDSLALESGGVPGLTRGENIPDWLSGKLSNESDVPSARPTCPASAALQECK
jgi:hypothetical protein